MHVPDRSPSLSVLLGAALKDLLHDRLVALCIVAAVVAVVAPLLLLFGLKHGVVSHMRHELLSNPQTLEVKVTGNGGFDSAWFDTMRMLPEVGFVVPKTRSLNTTADLRITSAQSIGGIELVPSGAGDPLLRALPSLQADTDLILSPKAAKELIAEPGDTVRLMVSRTRNGQLEHARLEMRIAAILQSMDNGRPMALVTLPLLVALEDFRDGAPVALLNVDSGDSLPFARQQFHGVRLYARDLDAVLSLSNALSAQGYDTVTQSHQIEQVQAIDKVLGIIFGVIAWTAVLGCAASLTGAFLANVDRKRKDLAMLQLLGYGRGAMVVYVMAQAVVLTALGFVLGVVAYMAGSAAFSHLLGSYMNTVEFLTRLEFIHYVVAFVVALLIAASVSAAGGVLATRIQPAESLREI